MSSTPVGVVEPLDVVLAEIAADLHLDQLKRNLSRIGEAMHAADRDVDRLVLMDGADILADRDLGRAPDDDPMLGAVEMLLQRKARAGFHHDALDLIARAGIDALV